MPRYSKKAQVLLTEDQYEALDQIAKKKHKKLGALLRDAADLVYLHDYRRTKIRESANQILNLNLPTTDWQEFEEEYTAHKYSS